MYVPIKPQRCVQAHTLPDYLTCAASVATEYRTTVSAAGFDTLNQGQWHPRSSGNSIARTPSWSPIMALSWSPIFRAPSRRTQAMVIRD